MKLEGAPHLPGFGRCGRGASLSRWSVPLITDTSASLRYPQTTRPGAEVVVSLAAALRFFDIIRFPVRLTAASGICSDPTEICGKSPRKSSANLDLQAAVRKSNNSENLQTTPGVKGFAPACFSNLRASF